MVESLSSAIVDGESCWIWCSYQASSMSFDDAFSSQQINFLLFLGIGVIFLYKFAHEFFKVLFLL